MTDKTVSACCDNHLGECGYGYCCDKCPLRIMEKVKAIATTEPTGACKYCAGENGEHGSYRGVQCPNTPTLSTTETVSDCIAMKKIIDEVCKVHFEKVKELEAVCPCLSCRKKRVPNPPTETVHVNKTLQVDGARCKEKLTSEPTVEKWESVKTIKELREWALMVLSIPEDSREISDEEFVDAIIKFSVQEAKAEDGRQLIKELREYHSKYPNADYNDMIGYVAGYFASLKQEEEKV